MTTTNYISEDLVKHMDFSPITEGMARRRVLILKFIVVSGMLKIETMPVGVRKKFCGVIWCLTVVELVDWIRPWGMK